MSADLVDGDEHAYRYDAGRNDFHRPAWRVCGPARTLVDPYHHRAPSTQVQGGFGLYLDMYINPPNSSWCFRELNGSRLNRFFANLCAATHVADACVWFIGRTAQLDCVGAFQPRLSGHMG
ncbi:MAG: hypothetical protein RMN51_07305 [Verrucomicrobiota bacterium]|nr:hypothetical protein [Verrucomicrobiota bacterium]